MYKDQIIALITLFPQAFQLINFKTFFNNYKKQKVRRYRIRIKKFLRIMLKIEMFQSEGIETIIQMKN